MISLTPQSWAGLPVRVCDNSLRLHVVDFELDSPVLVLWTFGESTVDVRRSAREYWHFRARPRAFDLYAEGVFEAVTISESPRAMLVLTLPLSLTAALLQSRAADLPLKHCRFQFADRPLERLVQALAAHARDNEPLGPLYTRSLSAAVLTRLVAIESPQRLEPEADGMSQATSETLRALIESRLAAPPSVDDLALVAGLSAADFVKTFRHAFGQTPHQFVLDLRIAKAKQLLAHGAPLTMLALELGFASHGHFTATFRARTGSTPSEYRRRTRESTHHPV
jgi:AraC family transcriptional regulator